jgi:SAM-dependent methyltransferase
MPPRQATAAALRRKELGAWYTPHDLVERVVAMTLRPTDRTVVDPACGDGRFLTACRRMTTTGVDVDPSAVVCARAAVPSAEVLCADALEMDWGRRTFDVVIGNPPFRSQLARLTSRGGRSRFGGGPYADTAAEFLALALRLARPDGGRIGLVLPQSILSTRDVEPIRAEVLQRGAVVGFWSTRELLFDAGVRTCVVVIELGASGGLVDRADSWASLLFGAAPAVADGPTLGDVATFTSDFRDQYYGLVGAVGDDVDGPPLVTSGLIDPGLCLWGKRPVRFAKSTYAAPRVDLARLSPRLQRWAASRLVPKLLIANQTRGIEAVVDRTGEWLPSVPVITCTTDRLDEVHAVLSSPAATDWVRAHAAGSGLSADTIRLTPSLLASIPLEV